MKPTKKLYQQIFQALNNSKQAVLTTEDVSQMIAIYPEYIAEALAQFDPLIPLNTDYNIKAILPLLKTYLLTIKVPLYQVNKPLKEEKKEGISVAFYIYDHLTIGGFFDKNYQFTLKQLKLLKSYIQQEIKGKKK
jgi:protein-arginine kinase